LSAAEGSYFAREHEIRAMDGSDNPEKEFWFRSFSLSSMTESEQYWDGVAEKCFALSAQMSPPIFALTITMNSYWPD
jgi:hypothetical protein